MSDIDEVRERLERACVAGMDAEYVDDVSDLLADHARLQAKLGKLQAMQARMRDPERHMVCDVIANGMDRETAGVSRYEVPDAQPVPAIDLEQFREAVESLRLGAPRAEHHEECDRLLALIDGQAADPRIDLAADHTGMLVDYSGLIGSAQRALINDPGIAEMLLQLRRHLEELGRRWYAGDRKVVDEFLQLYCIESEARAALVKRPTKGKGERHD